MFSACFQPVENGFSLVCSNIVLPRTFRCRQTSPTPLTVHMPKLGTRIDAVNVREECYKHCPTLHTTCPRGTPQRRRRLGRPSSAPCSLIPQSFHTTRNEKYVVFFSIESFPPSDLDQHAHHLVGDLVVTFLLVSSGVTVHSVHANTHLLHTKGINPARILSLISPQT